MEEIIQLMDVLCFGISKTYTYDTTQQTPNAAAQLPSATPPDRLLHSVAVMQVPFKSVVETAEHSLFYIKSNLLQKLSNTNTT